MRLAFVVSVLFLFVCNGVGAAPRSVQLEDLTWTEVRDAIAAGTVTIIIPAGGTEQNGPHMALGKHNARVRALGGQVATALGDALVAPVLAYVPEGSVSPPAGHMRFPGTISIPDSAFKATLEAAGRSFRQAGFRHIVLLGDSGDYQGTMREAAADLDRAWVGSGVRAHYIEDYYRAGQAAYAQALRARGLSESTIGRHAGAADTSLMLAVEPSLVRRDKLDGAPAPALGIDGDPRVATAELGRIGVELIVTRTVAAIRKARGDKQ